MFRTPLQDVDFQQVETFCHVWPEGVRVEYKQEMTQIPKIVSSFANTMGGIWLIGVKTDRKTNMPIFPLDGILAQPGIEERISQACWKGIHPALTPAIKVIPLPSNPERVVVAVKVQESIDAPHAIENTTKVYIRNASTTEPIEFAEIDRIEYLLNRRRDPEHRREQMIEVAIRRSSVLERRILIMIGPKYPYRPLFAREELDKCLRDLRDQNVIRWPMRRIQQGLISLQRPSDNEQFEVNQYGLICYARALNASDDQFFTRLLVFNIGTLLRIAACLLEETTINIFIRVRLEGVEGYDFTRDTSVPNAMPLHNQALEPVIVAETDAFRETLRDHFADHVTELVRQLLWAFNWADDQAIQSLVRNNLPSLPKWPEPST